MDAFFRVFIVLLFGVQMKILAKEYHLPPSYFNWLLVLFPPGNALSRMLSLVKVEGKTGVFGWTRSNSFLEVL